MKIEKGQDRLVFVLPFLGIVVKVPRILLWETIKLFFNILRNGGWKRVREFWDFDVYIPGVFKNLLFRGIAINWNEFRFYQKTRNSFLVPTYLSIFGFLNIQKLACPCKNHQGYWSQLLDLTELAILKDGHHFEHPGNLSLENGKLRMIDYGSLECQKIIARYGEKIFKLFDPNLVDQPLDGRK